MLAIRVGYPLTGLENTEKVGTEFEHFNFVFSNLMCTLVSIKL